MLEYFVTAYFTLYMWLHSLLWAVVEIKLHVVMDVVKLLVLRVLLILTLFTFKLQFEAPKKEPGVTGVFTLTPQARVHFLWQFSYGLY